MSEQPVETEAAVEAPAEPAERVDYDAELSRLQQEYDSQRPPQESEDRDGWHYKPDGEGDVPADGPPRLSSGDWENLENTFGRMADYISQVEDRRLVDASLARIRDNYDLALSNENLERLARRLVQENPAWQQAWQNQDADPTTWKNIENRLGHELHKEFGRRELMDVADIEAVELSVRSQVSGEYRKKIDASQVGSMSPVEYANWKRGVVGR